MCPIRRKHEIDIVMNIKYEKGARFTSQPTDMKRSFPDFDKTIAGMVGENGLIAHRLEVMEEGFTAGMRYAIDFAVVSACSWPKKVLHDHFPKQEPGRIRILLRGV